MKLSNAATARLGVCAAMIAAALMINGCTLKMSSSDSPSSSYSSTSSSSAASSSGAFNGLETNLSNLSRLSSAQSRSISPENFTGEKGKAAMATEGTGKGAARDLGQGWKVSPSVRIKAKTTFTMGEIEGPGCIQQIWMTPTGNWRHSILRFYWDGETEPSVECPVGDFFACGWGSYCQINSLAVCVNPGSAFNCYWQMPFRKKARITMENIDDKDMMLYYQINYALAPVPDDAAYFHAQFHRENPLKTTGLYTILDGVKGQGQFVGAYMAWEARSPGWWGEGEIKFYMDGDKEFPTICGTGTEDYFCGSYDFSVREARQLFPSGETTTTKIYRTFSTPYTGLAQVFPPDIFGVPGQRFGLYRWHITDPVRFGKDLKVTIHALGWQTGRRYLPLEDDLASVAYWYQSEPHAKFPALPGKETLAIAPISVVQPKPAAK
ncbi:MAG: DUF2961 domain-containing protein [Candidatus Sumerlaeota bacterium]|nr:DUF2961 domain-containing protein [Candidatus Sumerlaeota bacterium]